MLECNYEIPLTPDAAATPGVRGYPSSVGIEPYQKLALQMREESTKPTIVGHRLLDRMKRFDVNVPTTSKSFTPTKLLSVKDVQPSDESEVDLERAFVDKKVAEATNKADELANMAMFQAEERMHQQLQTQRIESEARKQAAVGAAKEAEEQFMAKMQAEVEKEREMKIAGAKMKAASKVAEAAGSAESGRLAAVGEATLAEQHFVAEATSLAKQKMDESLRVVRAEAIKYSEKVNSVVGSCKNASEVSALADNQKDAAISGAKANGTRTIEEAEIRAEQERKSTVTTIKQKAMAKIAEAAAKAEDGDDAGVEATRIVQEMRKAEVDARTRMEDTIGAVKAQVENDVARAVQEAQLAADRMVHTAAFQSEEMAKLQEEAQEVELAKTEAEAKARQEFDTAVSAALSSAEATRMNVEGEQLKNARDLVAQSKLGVATWVNEAEESAHVTALGES